jgi:proton-translocating NAD(P)+ transhydrogenase subunit alpha
MQIGVPREYDPIETRVALTPDIVGKYVKIGATVLFESGLGDSCHWSDQAYIDAGAVKAESREQLLRDSDMILRVRKPESSEIGAMRADVIHVSYLDPFNDRELVEALRESGMTALSMEMIPRTTLAQKMDALSSQHSIAGYYMVMLAADRLDKILPMMMTPAGTIQPARVFIIGAGVAGLQAIATAKRLGARVEAFDTRPVVKEQVESLGGRFVEIDLGDTGETDQGYAKELTEEQKKLQLEGMKKHCAQADVVITTAQLFGRPAPTVVTADMVAAMKPGSVIVDYAVESGGNVEGSVPGETVDINGVRIIGLRNYPGQMAMDASRMYASNLYSLVSSFWDEEKKSFKLDLEDEILASAVITHDKDLVSEMIRKAYGLEEVAS